MSDDSDIQNKTGKRRKRPLNPASSSESSDSGNELANVKCPRTQLASSSEDTDSDIDNEFVKKLRHKKRVTQNDASEDDSSCSEEEEIIAIRPPTKRGAARTLSDYESGLSDNQYGIASESSSESVSEDDAEDKNNAEKSKPSAAMLDSGAESDGQSEKCPICLARFTSQEIGTPEACDHCFCADCIQEWAKNVNTCPVDRQPFTLILVRQHLEGKVVRQIPVNTPANGPEIIVEDPTFCEVCGQSDREDRMLLCDACDHGYHMECLTPPLENVPIDEWFCPECALARAPWLRVRRARRARENTENEDNDVEADGDWNAPRRRANRRMVPRTRHAERVRMSLRNRQGNQPTRQRQNDQLQPTTSSGLESVEEAMRIRRQTTRTQRRKRTTRRKRNSNIRIKRIVTDDGIVEVVLKRKKKKRYTRKRKNRTLLSAPRTTKARLANKLGMCKPRMPRQVIPETLNRQELISAPINHQRHQAGVPTLDLFGRRDQLDYFSGSDNEEDAGLEGGTGLMSQVRVARPSDRLISRKKALSILSSSSPRKPIKAQPIAAPAGGSLLDSILDSQTLWHSKKVEIKSRSDGSVQVILPTKTKEEIVKESDKVDVRTAKAPVVETPMFPGGRGQSTGTFRPQRGGGGDNHSVRRGTSSYGGGSSQQSSGGGDGGYSRPENTGGPSPLRGMAPIRFRMNIPPRRPNIHSYPSDNIPPPPPLRLRSPVAELTFPTTNSPEASPARDEEEIDIYSDIEQQNNDNDTDEKSFGTLEPPPEPPFMMTLEPPPEPPAILMNLNDDGSDDEPSGLVIDDPPPGDVYDPCASEESSQEDVEDTNLPEPPELPLALKNSGLVSNYSSGSSPATESSPYNPELPTYSNTAMVIPLPRSGSRNSSEADDNDDECPNFSMYSAQSMNLAQRGLTSKLADLDIPVPPSRQTENAGVKEDIDIPLPDTESPKDDTSNIPIPVMSKNADLPKVDDKDLDIPFPEEQNKKNIAKSDEDDSVIPKDNNADKMQSDEEEDDNDSKQNNCKTENNDGKSPITESSLNIDHSSDKGDDNKDEGELDEDDGEDGDDEGGDADDDKDDSDSDSDSEGEYSLPDVDIDKLDKPKKVHHKESEEAAEDECSTQGDVLDLAIESEANLENNVPHEDAEERHELNSLKSNGELQEVSEKDLDGGEKSDGLVDITDEEMSVYDTTEAADDFEKSDELIKSDKKGNKGLYSDDDSVVIGAAAAVNSEYVPPQTLPGLEGLETETISESEDVNFDELPLDGNEQNDMLLAEEDHKSFKKKKRKNRKASHTEENFIKSSNEPLEFEEGEIIDDKPKQIAKKDKKIKPKPDITVEANENIDNSNKPKTPAVEKEVVEKKVKKKKDKTSLTKDKNDKTKEPKEKTLKAGPVDENISWKKISKNTKERNYRDAKEKEDRDKRRDSKEEELAKKRSKEKRKELERYDVRRLISEKPKRPKKDEFGRDISPSKSGSSLSPYRPPRYRSPLRTRNRSRTRSRSHRSRSRSKVRRRRSRSRERMKSREKPRRSRSKERKRSLSRKKVPSRERRKTPERNIRKRVDNRSSSRTKRRSRSHSIPPRRQRSLSLSRSWTPSFSRSSMSRSLSPGRHRSRSFTRSKSPSWPREPNMPSKRAARNKDPPKNLTVIVTNKEALRKKEKKKLSKRKDDRRKKKRGQSPAPSKEVFTSGDNILVSVNFKNANKSAEVLPLPSAKETSKRKREEADSASKKKKTGTSSKKSPTVKKRNRLAKINEAAKNAKPVAIIDLDLSPFREQTPSPKEVIVLSDSGDEGDKQASERENEMGNMSMNQSMMSLSSNDHGQKGSLSQPESPLSSNFMLNSSGPKTPPEPHIKFSIASKPSQIRIMSNPLMEDVEEEMQDEHIENDMNEILHKGPNTPPEPPPELNTPASPPTTPYDPFDPTKSRSPSPQPHESENGSQNISREDNMNKLESGDEPRELGKTTPPTDLTEVRRTPEPAKVHSTPKSDLNNSDVSPKGSPPSDPNKLSEDNVKPMPKSLSSSNKEGSVHKSPEKLMTVLSQQVKNVNQTPKQPAQPLKAITPIKHQTPKTNAKIQLFSNSLLKQVPILGTLPLLSNPTVYTQSMMNNSNKSVGRLQQNGDPSDDMDIDPSSPYSPGSSEGDDLFEPPMATPPRSASKSASKTKPPSGANKFDALFGSPAKPRHGRHAQKSSKKTTKTKSKGMTNKKEEIKVKLDEDQLKILDDLPSSAVEMQVKDKFLKKLNRQERVVEEVKLVLKPHYVKKHVTKDEYKDILRRAVPKICHNKSGEINPIKIQSLIEAYVKKFRYAKKKSSGATTNSAPAQNKPKQQKTLWS